MNATKAPKKAGKPARRYHDQYVTVCFTSEQMDLVRAGADPMIALGTWARIVLLQAAAERLKKQCLPSTDL